DYGLSKAIKDYSIDNTLSVKLFQFNLLLILLILQKKQSLGGNFKYMSPEVLEKKKPYNILFEVDETYLKNLKLKKDFEDDKKLRSLFIDKKNIQKQFYQSEDYSYDILEIDLSQNNLNAKAAKLVANLLEKYKNMTHLSLKLNKCNIGTEESENISKSIAEKLLGISYLFLDFKNNEVSLTEEEVEGKEEQKEVEENEIEEKENLENLVNAYKKHSISKKIKLTNQNKNEMCFSSDDNQINSDEAKTFANIVNSYKSIKHLTVDFSNEMDNQKVKNIKDQINQYDSIKSLRYCIKRNKNSLTEFLEVFNALEVCKQFTHLNLKLDECNQIDANGIKSLAKALEDKDNILSLNLDFNKKYYQSDYFIDQEAVQSIANTLQKLKKLCHINLSLDCRGIKEEGAERLSKALKDQKNVVHLILNLSDNSIGVQGAQSIANAIEKYQNVTELNLNFTDNSIGVQGAQSIANAIEKYQNVTELNLNFTYNSIGVQGAQSIANAIEKYQNVTKLNLNFFGNSIGVQGAQSIANAIEKYQNVTKLNLNFTGNSIGVQGAQSIANAIEKYQNVTELNLNFTGNSIGDEGAQSIANAIEKYQNVTKLNLNFYYNSIGDERAQSIAKAIEKYQNVTKLNLNFT
ncbi:hypothetical protein ABPG72_009292, partial [Tetrahymena utriculariae]